MRSRLNFLSTIVKSITIEPCTIFGIIAISMYGITVDLGIYRVNCDKMFNSNGGSELNNHTSFECWDTRQALGAGLGSNGSEWWTQAEVELQQKTTTYNMIVTMCNMVPSIFSNMILGAYGDRRGRKYIIAIGTLGMAFMMIPLPIIFAAPLTTPLYIAFIASGVSGLVTNFLSSSTAYLADTVENREMLAIRMTIVTMCMTVGIIVAPLMANALLSSISYSSTAIIAMCLALAGSLSALLILKDVKPKDRLKLQEPADLASKSIDPMETKIDQSINSDQSHDQSGCLCEMKNVILDMPHMMADSFRTIFKKRAGHERAYLITVACSLFVIVVMDSTFNGGIMALYVQKQPLSWDQSRITYFKSATSLTQLIGGTVGVFMFKKIFKMADSFIVIIAFCSLLAQAIFITFATTSWMLFVASSVSVVSQLSMPCLFAFVAKILKPDEVGKAYGVYSVFTNLAMIFSNVAVAAIYKATVATFPTLIFAVCTAITFAALALVVWLHMDMHGNTVAGFFKGCRQKSVPNEKENA